MEDGPGPGAWNMAVDHALMASARRGVGVLRLYGWAPPCLSFGRNQAARDRYRKEEALRRGIDVVRRPTGGRAVYHHRELTYSVVAPAEAWGGLRRSYARINSALRRGLSSLGAPVEVAEGGGDRGTPGPTARACFRDPLPGELMAGGRKLVGSAQWREDGVLLQHGSLLLRDEQGVLAELRGDGRDAGEGPGATALAEILDRAPGADEVAEALRGGFEAEFDVDLQPSRITGDERERAERLVERYEDEGWTWRR